MSYFLRASSLFSPNYMEQCLVYLSFRDDRKYFAPASSLTWTTFSRPVRLWGTLSTGREGRGRTKQFVSLGFTQNCTVCKIRLARDSPSQPCVHDLLVNIISNNSCYWVFSDKQAGVNARRAAVSSPASSAILPTVRPLELSPHDHTVPAANLPSCLGPCEKQLTPRVPQNKAVECKSLAARKSAPIRFKVWRHRFLVRWTVC